LRFWVLSRWEPAQDGDRERSELRGRLALRRILCGRPTSL